eukprot:gene12126-2213_t
MQVVQADIRLPSTDDWQDIVVPVQEALAAHPEIKLCVFSHIVSAHTTAAPAVILPVDALARACKAAGVPTFLDGAHALGNIDLDMKALQQAVDEGGQPLPDLVYQGLVTAAKPHV